jgi:hypothetical protein
VIVEDGGLGIENSLGIRINDIRIRYDESLFIVY